MQVNYYTMKTIYCLFKEDFPGEAYQDIAKDKERTKHLIRQTASRVCSCEKDEQLVEVVVRIVVFLLLPPDETALVTSVRVAVRTYGFYSDEFIGQLQRIAWDKPLPFINYKELEGQIEQLCQVRNKNESRKLESACSNLERNYRLGNNRKFLKDLACLFRFGCQLAQLSPEEKKTVVRGCLTLLTEDEVQPA